MFLENCEPSKPVSTSADRCLAQKQGVDLPQLGKWHRYPAVPSSWRATVGVKRTDEITTDCVFGNTEKLELLRRKDQTRQKAPSPREFGRTRFALPSIATRIHEERGLGERSKTRFNRLTLLMQRGGIGRRCRSRKVVRLAPHPQPFSHKFGDSLIQWQCGNVRIFGEKRAMVKIELCNSELLNESNRLGGEQSNRHRQQPRSRHSFSGGFRSAGSDKATPRCRSLPTPHKPRLVEGHKAGCRLATAPIRGAIF